MKTQFFLYDYSLEEKNKFLEKVMNNLTDLIFVFELNSSKVIFHNNYVNPHSNWESILASPNLFEEIKLKLSPNDLPALMQLTQKLYSLSEREFIVRELHIKNNEQVYGHYQVEMSLFEKKPDGPVQIMCKVHALQEQIKIKDLFNTDHGLEKIILVDDDELTNILNKKIINSVLPNTAVEVFLDIDEALSWLKVNDQSGNYLIFLDINFPGRNGWDFMQDYSSFSIVSKVIMLSSSIVQADKIKALAYKNVVQYLSKPLSFDFLETLLK